MLPKSDSSHFQKHAPHFTPELPRPKSPQRTGCSGCGCGGCGVGAIDWPIDQLPVLGPAITKMFGKVRAEAGAGAEAAVKPIVSTAVVVSLVSVGVAAAALITLLVINSKKHK